MPSTIKTSLFICGLFILILFVLFIVNAIYSLRAHNAAGARVTIGTHTYLADVADTPALKMRGLSGRESLTTGRGMLFEFSTPGLYPFWMKGMKFSIDFIWIRAGRVVSFDESAPPDQGLIPKIYKPIDLVDAVLEVPAGTVVADGLKIGDGVIIEPIQ